MRIVCNIFQVDFLQRSDMLQNQNYFVFVEGD